ncbi:hypothetical protein M433DRAFT_151423 [Acidomyces richmondensis BFW]|nr:MAG: hypothetical protein FE78DRAFT_84941 [Acidomyces sp. 'richmondensis']KYG48134.1 hypothetical protein M433DRAFT_151423 [Acidomyces richmondensis BFW]
MVPKPQVEYLCNSGFAVVIPNYRLAPQVSAKEAFADCEEAHDWSIDTLPDVLQSIYGVSIDTTNIVACGHSCGGTLAIHLGSVRSLKAVTAFYPSLFSSDPTTSIHQPTSAPPFGLMPDFYPSEDDWRAIKPRDIQVSEAPLAKPGTVPAPRNQWQMHILKHGQWLPTVQPDGDYAGLDPITRLATDWPPVMIVQGDIDNVPGSSLELARRFKKEMQTGGVKEVRLEVVHGEGHMFDLSPVVGTCDFGPKWVSIVKGLDWLKNHLQTPL